MGRRKANGTGDHPGGCIGELVTGWRNQCECANSPDSVDVASESDYLRHLEERHRAGTGARDLCRTLQERTRDYVEAHQGDAWLAGREPRRR